MIEKSKEKSTAVWLTEREQFLLILMKWIDSKDPLGTWNIKTGRIIIDFDKDNRIGNLSITHNYKPDV